MSPSFVSPEAFEAFDFLLHPTLQSSRGMPFSETWQEEADPEVNLEAFYGDFNHASTPINEGINLQELSHIDVAASGLSSDLSARISFMAVCLSQLGAYTLSLTDEC